MGDEPAVAVQRIDERRRGEWRCLEQLAALVYQVVFRERKRERKRGTPISS